MEDSSAASLQAVLLGTQYSLTETSNGERERERVVIVTGITTRATFSFSF